MVRVHNGKKGRVYKRYNKIVTVKVNAGTIGFKRVDDGLKETFCF